MARALVFNPTILQVEGLEPSSSVWKTDRLAINIYLRPPLYAVFSQRGWAFALRRQGGGLFEIFTKLKKLRSCCLLFPCPGGSLREPPPARRGPLKDADVDAYSPNATFGLISLKSRRKAAAGVAISRGGADVEDHPGYSPNAGQAYGVQGRARSPRSARV